LSGRVSMRSNALTVGCTMLGVLLLLPSAPAIETEDWPAYMTDTHGAAGVCWFLVDLKEVDPIYERYYWGALDWLVAVAEWDGDTCGWWVSTTAPEGHPNHTFTTGGGAIFDGLSRGYMASGDERYSDAALGGIRATMDNARAVATPYGQGYWWGKRVGHSHGPGSVGDMLIDAHDRLGEESVLPYIYGLLNWLRNEAVFSTDGLGNTLAMWPEDPGGTAYETGYCYGNAGTLAFVLNAANHFPGFEYPDGKDLRWLVNANIRWLMSIAVDVPAADGIIWRYMRHDELSTNMGWGSGISGIGEQFLDAYELNDAAGDPFADECLEYAGKAAKSVVYKANLVSTISRGACGGEGGVAWFLVPLADELDATDPEFAQECRDAASRIADLVVDDRLRFGDRTAWKSSPKFGDQAVNIALDYGVTGLGWALYLTGMALGRDDLVAVAREAGDYLRFIAVWDERGGCKWPQIIPYGPNDADDDGVFDDWDAFPTNPDEAVDSDSDGMGDNFEWSIVDDDPDDSLYGFADVLPTDDYDGDGASNLTEFQLGTDPTSWTDVSLYSPAWITALLAILLCASRRKWGTRPPNK